jgi:hypothetical protein
MLARRVPTMASATSRWISNTSAIWRSNSWDHNCCPVRGSTSCALMRTRSPALRTLPSSTLPTPSSVATSPSDWLPSSARATAVRLMTRRPESRASWPAISSVMPAAKYASVGSGE